MSESNRQQPKGSSAPLERDPRDWKTADEPMTSAQRSYLETLATEAREHFDEKKTLTKAEAALRIDELQRKTGRGQPTQS